MEPYFVCKTCGEKNSTNFTYCRKCGAELSVVEKTHQSAQEKYLPPSSQEKSDIIDETNPENLVMRTCPSCQATVITTVKICSKCGYTFLTSLTREQALDAREQALDENGTQYASPFKYEEKEFLSSKLFFGIWIGITLFFFIPGLLSSRPLTIVSVVQTATGALLAGLIFALVAFVFSLFDDPNGGGCDGCE
ncbi:MAG: zinc-ribbon domain-containing protein [Candidatus Hodarchaeales archaeon]|jgi:ribosomal protein L40E